MEVDVDAFTIEDSGAIRSPSRCFFLRQLFVVAFAAFRREDRGEILLGECSGRRSLSANSVLTHCPQRLRVNAGDIRQLAERVGALDRMRQHVFSPLYDTPCRITENHEVRIEVHILAARRKALTAHAATGRVGRLERAPDFGHSVRCH